MESMLGNHIIVMNAPPRNTNELITTIGMGGLRSQAFVFEVIDTERRGCFFTAKDVFGAAAEMGGPITVVQDDIAVCRNFADYIGRELDGIERDDLIVSWFDTDRAPIGDTPNCRYYPRKAERFRMTQAVTYSSLWVKKIYVFFTALPTPTPDDRGQVHGDDMWIRECLLCYKKSFLVHSPSLVQHIGEDSLVAPGIQLHAPEHARTAQNFVGVDFDPLIWEPYLTKERQGHGRNI